MLNKNRDGAVANSGLINLGLDVVRDLIRTHALRPHFNLVVANAHRIHLAQDRGEARLIFLRSAG